MSIQSVLHRSGPDHGATITNNIRDRVRAVIHNPYSYLCDRYDWTQSTYSTIDWDSFGIVFSRKSSKNRQFTFKLCNRKLPTGLRLSKIHQKHECRCSSCTAEIEDDNHIFCCPARRHLRYEIIRRLKLNVFKFLDPSLQTILREGMFSYFNNQPPPNPTRFDEPYSSLVEHQNNIGWDNLFRGKFAVDWNLIQKPFIISSINANPTKLLRKAQHANIVTAIYSTIYGVLHEMWKERCDDRHKRCSGRPSVTKLHLLCTEVRELYNLKDYVLPEDRVAFRDDIDIHLTDSVRQLRAWLHRWRRVLPNSARKYSELSTASTKTIPQLWYDTDPRQIKRPRIHRR